MALTQQFYSTDPKVLAGFFRVGDPETHEIEVYNRIFKAKDYRIYYGNGGIVKIAKTSNGNKLLSSEIQKFSALKDAANEVDKGMERSDDRIGYDLLFTDIVDSFTDYTYGRFKVNIHFIKGNYLSGLVPLTRMRYKWQIDAQSSVWVLLKILKFYELLEKYYTPLSADDARYPAFNPDDILLSPFNQRVIFYNFSEPEKELSPSELIKEIADFFADWADFDIALDMKEADYFFHIEDLAEYGHETFAGAWQELDDLTKKLWGSEYHYFTFRKYRLFEGKRVPFGDWKEDGGLLREGGREDCF